MTSVDPSAGDVSIDVREVVLRPRTGLAAGRTVALVTLFGLTMLLSAFLLFQVQPLISKAILPWFGGTPQVWTTCMLFFQILLFAGYAYAHYSTQWLSPRAQGLLHGALVAAALFVLPILPAASWKPVGPAEPIHSILLLLAANVGLPYFLLATTSPLIQHWWDAARAPGSPYRLYALSNAGSLLALVSYPFLVEPLLSLGYQGAIWSAAFLVFAVAVLACGSAVWWRSAGSDQPTSGQAFSGGTSTSAAAADPVTWWQRGIWVSLAAVGSLLLLATTNHISHDIAVVPLLWVAPLSLYLLTFIICFAGRPYPRLLSTICMMVSTCYIAMDQVGATEWLGDRVGLDVPRLAGVANNYLGALALYLFAMFAACMVCHGELARLKPAPAQLTSFYLHISFGGAVGGMAVALGGPLLLTGHYELSIGMVLCWLLVLLVACNERGGWLYGGRPMWAWSLVSLIYILFAFAMSYDALKPNPARVAVSRNFYGVLAVNEKDSQDEDNRSRELVNGLILHGVQYLREDKRRWPVTYYGPKSGVGLAMAHAAQHRNVRIGVVGLGIGTMAVYGREGDYVRFYEIDPDVVDFSGRYFHYLSDTPARYEIAMGDARISLERELEEGGPQRFDVLVLDAFSSDAIPVHLLTQEAFALYLQHMRGDAGRQGIVAAHISNRYLDLLPILQSAAMRYDLDIAQVDTRADKKKHVYESNWVLMSRRGGLRQLIADHRSAVPRDPRGNEPVWTDDYSNILSVLE